MAGALAGGDRGGGGIGLAGPPAPAPAHGAAGGPPLAARGVATPAPAAAAGGLDAAALRRLERLSHWMDGAFRLPGTRWRFGLDGLLGLVPGAGDSLTALVGAYVVLEAYRAGAPASVIARMLGNIGLDWAVGSVPLLGDVFDFAFKAHRRNVDLLRRHLGGRR
jgi:Domain of unknown function (DUF4112)